MRSRRVPAGSRSSSKIPTATRWSYLSRPGRPGCRGKRRRSRPLRFRPQRDYNHSAWTAALRRGVVRPCEESPMRLRTLVAVVVLLGLAGLVAFFLLGPRADEQRAYAPRKLAPEVSARMEADARKKLAFESLTERLPKGKPVSPTRPIGPEAKERWERLDNELATWQMPRAKLLQELHEKTRKFFVESPGEGAMRRQLTPEEILLDEFNGAAGTTDQPGEQADFPLSPGEPLSRVEPNRDFYHYHSDGVSNFLYPRGFGHVQDRAHVAGFKSHGFRSDAYPAWRVENWSWRFQYIQLVGILSHETPVVYLTDQLPSMEQVRQG